MSDKGLTTTEEGLPEPHVLRLAACTQKPSPNRDVGLAFKFGLHVDDGLHHCLHFLFYATSFSATTLVETTSA